MISWEYNYFGLQKRILKFSLFSGNDELLEVFEAQEAPEKIYWS